jgi:hypothetical protein
MALEQRVARLESLVLGTQVSFASGVQSVSPYAPSSEGERRGGDYGHEDGEALDSETEDAALTLEDFGGPYLGVLLLPTANSLLS